MKKVSKKILAFTLATVMMMSCFTSAFAINSDIDNHWANSVLTKWIEKGYIGGYPDNTFRPDNYITRAEFVKMINTVMGYTETAEISFNDVKSSDWFYQDIKIAKAKGYIKGVSTEKFEPNSNMTREQAAAIIGRLFGFEDDESGIKIFKDANSISQWAKGIVGSVALAGFINGYPDGTFRPTRYITRAESVKMINNTFSVTGPMTVEIVGKKSVEIGKESNYSAKFYDKDKKELKNEKVKWSVSKYDGVTISDTGKLIVDKKAKEGKFTITAVSVSNPLVKASLEVSAYVVRSGGGGSVPTKTYTIEISGPSDMIAGTEKFYVATIKDNKGNIITGKSVEWTVTGSDKVTVNSKSGLVKASEKTVNETIVTVTAKCAELNLTKEMAVKISAPEVTSIAISGESTIVKGRTAKYNTIIRDQNFNIMAAEKADWYLKSSSGLVKNLDNKNIVISNTGLLEVKDGAKLKSVTIVAVSKTKNTVKSEKTVNIDEQAYSASIEIKSTGTGNDFNKTGTLKSYSKDTTVYTMIHDSIETGITGEKPLIDINKIINDKLSSQGTIDIVNGKINLNAEIHKKISSIEPKIKEAADKKLEEQKEELKGKVEEQLKTAIGQIDGILDILSKFDSTKDQLKEKQAELKKAEKNLPKVKVKISEVKIQLIDAKVKINAKQAEALRSKEQLEKQYADGILPKEMYEKYMAEINENLKIADAKLAEISSAQSNIVEFESVVNNMEGKMKSIGETITKAENIDANDMKSQVNGAKTEMEGLLPEIKNIVGNINITSINNIKVTSSTIKFIHGDKVYAQKTYNENQINNVDIKTELMWFELQVRDIINDYNLNHPEQPVTIDESIFNFSSLYKEDNTVDVLAYINSVNANIEKIVEEAKKQTNNPFFNEPILVVASAEIAVETKLGGTEKLDNLLNKLDSMSDLIELGTVAKDLNDFTSLVDELNSAVRDLKSAEIKLKNIGVLDDAGFGLTIDEMARPDFGDLSGLEFTGLDQIKEVSQSLNGNIKATAKDLEGAIEGLIYNAKHGGLEIVKYYNNEITVAGKTITPKVIVESGNPKFNNTSSGILEFFDNNYKFFNSNLIDVIENRDSEYITIKTTAKGKTVEMTLRIQKSN